ncbi:MAG: hypothetical protein ACK5P5_14545 [Pseudobdellovibrionaceae bacterium]
MKTRSNRKREDWSQLRNAKDYRNFLKIYLEIRNLSLSDFARAAGCHRGFPGDVISGKRRLTAQSSFVFEKALKAPLAAKKFFRSLIALEEEDLYPEIDRNKIDLLITELRQKNWNRSHREMSESSIKDPLLLMKIPKFMSVFAASGSPGHGAYQHQIQKRTGIHEPELSDILTQLATVGLVKKIHGDFFEPQELHLFVKNTDQAQLMKNIFQNAAALASRRVDLAATSKSEMFFASSFCIQESKMPELKNLLRQTILNFIDESIDADGDRVVQLITALHI